MHINLTPFVMILQNICSVMHIALQDMIKNREVKCNKYMKFTFLFLNTLY
jgi:hypothetical protein